MKSIAVFCAALILYGLLWAIFLPKPPKYTPAETESYCMGYFPPDPETGRAWGAAVPCSWIPIEREA